MTTEQTKPVPESNLPVLELADIRRNNIPCLVKRDGMHFIHDDERPNRTYEFFRGAPL